MRLKALLIAASLAASPVCAQQTPPSSPPDASSQKPQTPTVTAITSPNPADVPVVSTERVREELAKPPPILKPPNLTPNFTVHIEERRPLQEIFDTPAWAIAGASFPRTCPPRQASYLPEDNCTSSGGGGGTDVLPLLRQAKRAHDARAAHEEAQREIEAYCAAQPNGGKDIEICPARSAIR